MLGALCGRTEHLSAGGASGANYVTHELGLVRFVPVCAALQCPREGRVSV